MVETLSPIRCSISGSFIDLTTSFNDQRRRARRQLESKTRSSRPRSVASFSTTTSRRRFRSSTASCARRVSKPRELLLPPTRWSQDRGDARLAQGARLLYATKSGISIGIEGPGHPEPRRTSSSTARLSEVKEVDDQYREGAITKVSATTRSSPSGPTCTELASPKRCSRRWSGKSATVGVQFNPVYMMADSGARGSQAADSAARRYARPDGEAVG